MPTEYTVTFTDQNGARGAIWDQFNPMTLEMAEAERDVLLADGHDPTDVRIEVVGGQ